MVSNKRARYLSCAMIDTGDPGRRTASEARRFTTDRPPWRPRHANETCAESNLATHNGRTIRFSACGHVSLWSRIRQVLKGLPGGVTVARLTLDQVVEVRILAGQMQVGA